MIKINILIPVHKGVPYNRGRDLAREMSERGRERIENYFTWDAVCKKLERVYKDIVERNNKTEVGEE